MLKTLQDGSLWMVTQIDHSAIAGFLAAHWGNAEFARPGYFGTAKDPERLRDETVFAIAQHDNGWCAQESTCRIRALAPRSQTIPSATDGECAHQQPLQLVLCITHA